MTRTSEPTALATDALTIPDLFERAAHRFPARPALIEGPSGTAVSYRDLQHRIELAAGWLHRAGVGPGDRTAIVAPNVPPVAALVLASMRLGAAVTTLNPIATAHEIGRQLDDAGVEVVCAVPDAVAAVRQAGRNRILVLGNPGPEGGTALRDALAGEAHRGRAPLDPASVALLPYSSGTTGTPKGVMLSHDALVAVVRRIVESIQVGEADTTIALAPFFHILGMTAGLLVPLAVGATVVTQPRFDPPTFLALLERHRATFVAVPPPVAAMLAHHPAVADHDLSSLRLLAVGGAALPPATQLALASRLAGCVVGQGWGLTETSGAICVPRAGEATAPGTVGRPLPDTEVRVVDPHDGRPLGPGEDGELLIRGPQTMLGYLGRPDETRAVLDPEGWVHTGDLGHVDEDGTVVIVDRLKDLIKVSAFQVAPAEVEAALVSHPAVADAAVTAIDDERTGQVPVAFVVPAGPIDLPSVEDHLVARLSPYKRPARIHVVDSLPRTPSGKLLRRELRP